MSNTKELSRFLVALLAEYRDRNGKKDPERIYLSPGVLAQLKAEEDATLNLKKTPSGYTFDGIPLQEKPGQALIFVLRP